MRQITPTIWKGLKKSLRCIKKNLYDTFNGNK